MDTLFNGLEAVTTLALLIAAVITAVSQARKAGLTWLETVAAAADAVVRKIEQDRKNTAKEGLHYTGPTARDVAITELMRRLNIDRDQAKAAVEAAVSRLPKSNLVIRNERGQFSKPSPQ